MTFMLHIAVFGFACFLLGALVSKFIFSSVTPRIHTKSTPYLHVDEDTVFASPVDAKEAFKRAKSVDSFISQLK